ENTAGIQLVNVLSIGANTFDTDGASNTKVFTLLSTNDLPTADASIAALSGATPSTQLGKITVQRHMSRIGVSQYYYQVWRDISSPVQGASVGMIKKSLPVTGPFTGSSLVATITPQGGSTNYTQNSLIYYNEKLATWPGFPATTQDTSVVFMPGQGYSIFIFGPDSEHPVGSQDDSWWVRGVANTGSLTLNATSNPKLTFTSGKGNGWNLIGNPYPSAIDWTLVNPSPTTSKVSNAIYFDDYNTANGTAVTASWVNGVSTYGASKYIPTGQGFWVKATGTGASLTFSETSKANPTIKPIFYRETAPSNLLRINVASDKGQSDEAVIYFLKGATEGVDLQYDAEKMMNRFGQVNLSTVTGAYDRFAINALPYNCSRTVSLDIANVKTGTYHLDFTGLSSFSSSMQMQLKDHLANTSTDLRQASTYSFSVNENDSTTFGAKRFSVVFTDNGKGIIKSAEISMPDAQTLQSNYADGNQWYDDGQLIAGATSQNFKPTKAGLYRVEVASHGCRVSAEKVFTLSDEKPKEMSLTAYPNPTSGMVTLEVRSGTIAEGEIDNSMGVKMSSFTFESEGDVQQAKIDLSKLPSGMYIVRVQQGEKVSLTRVVKE
ncbi:MAG TPA: hypothetical protein DGG95_10800, partial [Cytophagales bacterium]|nr:hypothetical protein [Cytophagales bacterium]